jgi:hypothetical protein
MSNFATPQADQRDVIPAVPPPPPPRRLRIVQVLTVLAILAALGATIYFRDRLQELKQYGYAAVFLVGLVSNATVVLPVPGLAVSSVMGGVFNPWIVGLVGGLGQALGELTGYMDARRRQSHLQPADALDAALRHVDDLCVGAYPQPGL